MSAQTALESLRADAARRRLATVREAVDAAGLDGLVVYGPGRHSFLRSNPCWYLSGFKQLGQDAALVVPVDDEPHLLVTPVWDLDRAREESWIDRVSAVSSLAAAIDGEAVATLRGRRLGCDGLGAAPAAVARAVHSALEPVDADGLVDATARVHDELALDSIRRAVQIAEAVVLRAAEVARPGVPEAELSAECAAASYALGADDNFLLMSASEHNHAVHSPGDRVLFEGDVVLAEISPSVSGQFAQICRTIVIGEPTAPQRQAYDVLLEALAAGIERATPGTPVAEVAETIDDVLAGRGFERYNRPPYMRTRGHAMGLGAMVPGEISAASSVVLEPGMSFVLHPNQYFPDCGYLLCGDQVLIEPAGCRSLAEPFDLGAVPA